MGSLVPRMNLTSIFRPWVENEAVAPCDTNDVACTGRNLLYVDRKLVDLRKTQEVVTPDVA